MVAISTGGHAAGKKTVHLKGNKRMIVTFFKQEYILGEPIKAEIRIVNSSDHAREMDNPSKSLYLVMHAVDLANKEDYTYAMGEYSATDIDRKSGQYALVAPPREKITLKAGEEFRFATDLNERLFLRQGAFECFLKDEDQVSNQVRIDIRFCPESIELLLKHAKNDKAEYSRREWSMELIQEIYPRFVLKLPLPEEPGDTISMKRIHNATVIKEFEQWWSSSKNSEEVRNSFNQME